jgi:hypothetical protein
MCKRNRVRMFALPFILAAMFSGCSQSPQAGNAPDVAGAPAQPDKPNLIQRIFSSTRSETLPQGTVLEVVLDQTISSGENRSGDSFEATLAAPVVIEGKMVIPKDAKVHGHVDDAEGSGRLKGVAHLDLTLDSIEVGGKSYDLQTSHIDRTGQNHNKRNGELIGGGAGVGALIGALAGGGKGAVIGGAVGAGAGTGTAAYTGKQDIRVPAETRLSFQLSRPLTITMKG